MVVILAAGYTQSNDGDIISKANISFDFLASKFSSERHLRMMQKKINKLNYLKSAMKPFLALVF